MYNIMLFDIILFSFFQTPPLKSRNSSIEPFNIVTLVSVRLLCVTRVRYYTSVLHKICALAPMKEPLEYYKGGVA